MAFKDPSFIRDVIIQVRLNEAEGELLDAIVKFTGQQRSSTLRDLFIRQAKLVLSGQADLGGTSFANEDAGMQAFQSRQATA
jgi:hypothetical protein